MTYAIYSLVIVFTVVVFGMMVWKYRKDRGPTLTKATKVKLCICGFLAFVADPIGIGSFAVVIAVSKFWKLLDDQELPGLVNGAQVLPGGVEAVFFLSMIHVDHLTLIVLVAGTCVGGVLGGLVVSKLKPQVIRMSMAVAFVGIAVLILLKQLDLLPISGHDTLLRSWKLWVGFFAMIICGSLPAVGVGLFALVESTLFLLGLSPLIAFPIMTTAGALQQPLTTVTFLLHGKIPLKQVLLISCIGVIAVLIVVPLVSHLSLSGVRWLLLAVLIYNSASMFKSYIKEKKGNAP